MNVRTRVAPSPTGAPHIGTAYIALFNYAFAKRHGGQFILRIEDTDQVRSTRESETAIFDALRWIGLPWDEGPDTGGPHGPYRQSERTEIYREHCAQLVAAGRAYPCFCSPERLKALREQQMATKEAFVGYDGKCAALSADEARTRMETGAPHVIRMHTPVEGTCVMQDRLRGDIRIPWNTVDDQILLKADGFPTYHLANVVDDHLMEISHVIRGEEWIYSTPKHLALYAAFGWEPPEFVHLPLLRNPDKSKMSKRSNPTSILYYRQAGFLPEALINFLGLMAYSPADEEEIFDLEKLASTFDIERISLGGPIFDIQKLRNFNGRYIRELGAEELFERLRAWMVNEETWQRVIPLAQNRLCQLSDLVLMAAFLFADRMPYDPGMLVDGFEDPAAVAPLLKVTQWELEKTRDWTVEGIKGVFTAVSEKENLKLKRLLAPFFIALTGTRVSLPLFDSMVIVGKDMCLRRIQYALEGLAELGQGLSGKKVKKLTKEYQQRYRE